MDSLDEQRSIMGGGKVRGWMPDVAVVLWQRMLGCLGDVNKIEDADIHATVFDALAELLDTLCRVRPVEKQAGCDHKICYAL